VDSCLEDVSRYADVVEYQKGSSPAYLDGCEVFNRGDGGSSDTAVVRKAEGEGGELRFRILRDFASFDSICSRRRTQ